MASIADAVKKIEAYYCLDCGKCTGICPVSRTSRDFSPRKLLLSALRGERDGLFQNSSIWACLTCALCDEKCPSGIRYIELTKAIRLEAHGKGEEATCSHGGAFQSLMRIMTSPKLNQNRLEWIDKDLKVKNKGDVLYFVGCAPYFDAFFSDIGAETLKSARSTIQILNRLGIEPVVLRDERCCGHDLLWGGDFEGFKRLALHNLSAIEKSGAKKVVFSCPEGYRTFKLDYAEHFGPLKFEVQHLSELVADEIGKGNLELHPKREVVTYQDPCRLGRHLGVYDEPRAMLNAIPDVDFREMGRSRNGSICCGVSAWLHCDAATKLLQVQRLREAESTGAGTMVVACPKCEIHFRCTMSGSEEDFKIDIKDLATLTAEAMEKPAAKRQKPVKATAKKMTGKPKKAKGRKAKRSK